MIDFVRLVSNHFDKNTPFFQYCKKVADYVTGIKEYKIQGCEVLKLLWKPSGLLTISGSIPYYWQGHNFSFANSDFYQAIEHLSKLLAVDLWKSVVSEFEFGVIIESDTLPKHYISNHKARKEAKLNQYVNEKDKGRFTSWKDKGRLLKMYDAGANIQMKQGLSRKKAIRGAGWQPEKKYLKFEIHYLDASILNKGRELLLADIMHPDWQQKFKEDLLEQYKRLTPMATIKEPSSKKDLTTSDIIALALVENGLNNNQSIEEVKKNLYSRINVISDSILSKADKDSRKRHIKTILDKIQVSDNSKWDLTEKLAQALEG